MTTEDDFQRMLDAHPDDHQTRLVFADWLEERGDERAEGYRALGLLRHHTGGSNAFPCWWTHEKNGTANDQTQAQLPRDWFDRLRDALTGGNWWRDYPSRRAGDDAAALAFACLPAERRAELLAGVAAGAS